MSNERAKIQKRFNQYVYVYAYRGKNTTKIIKYRIFVSSMSIVWDLGSFFPSFSCCVQHYMHPFSEWCEQKDSKTIPTCTNQPSFHRLFLFTHSSTHHKDRGEQNRSLKTENTSTLHLNFALIWLGRFSYRKGIQFHLICVRR